MSSISRTGPVGANSFFDAVPLGPSTLTDVGPWA
jgi:hypothetical protein